MTLTEFLLAQLDADEAVAQAVLDEHPMRDWESFISDAGHYEGNASVFARDNNPAHVLDQIAAVRDVVGLHQDSAVLDHWEFGCTCGFTRHRKSECSCGKTTFDEGEHPRQWGPCPTLAALALPYADHRDYREEWRP